MISLYGESGLFELIELAKMYGWQIFETGLGEMIDLDNPEKMDTKTTRNMLTKY